MNLVGGLVTAGVGGVAALLGAWIGARATRRASVEAFDRAATADRDAWRKALRYECRLNLSLDKERDAEQAWSFDTRVLRDSFNHVGAFSEEVMQRIIWARTLSEQMDDAIANYQRDRGTVRRAGGQCEGARTAGTAARRAYGDREATAVRL